MFLCKNGGCPVKDTTACCVECSVVNCEHRCEHDLSECGLSYEEKPAESTNLTLFQSNAMVIMQKIAELDVMKKQLEAQDKMIRQELQEAMDKLMENIHLKK